MSTVSIPEDFSTTQGVNGLFYQLVGDSRPSNITNGSNIPLSDIPFAGTQSFANGSVTNSGPAYSRLSTVDFLPYILFDQSRDLVLLHPLGSAEGQGGVAVSPSIGAAITFESPATYLYSISGAFARANNFRLAGNGVDVVIAKNGALNALLFEETITADHFVDADDPFSGTGVAPFDFNIELVQGDRLSFIVFVDDQGIDQTFDATALRFDLTQVNSSQVPEGSSLIGLILPGTLGVGLWLRRKMLKNP